MKIFATRPSFIVGICAQKCLNTCVPLDRRGERENERTYLDRGQDAALCECALYSAALHCIGLQFITLHCNKLQYTALYCTSLH